MTAPNPGGAGLGTATGHINISTAGAQQAAVQMRGVAGNIQQSFSGINASAQQAQSSVGGLENAFKGLAGVMGVTLGIAGVAQIGRMAIGIAETAAQVDRTRFAFENLSGGADKAKQNLDAIQVAARNTISEFEAMSLATTAMSLKLANSAEGFTELVRAARATTMVSPVIRDISSAMTEIGLAAANLSFRRLDQLGLTVSEVKQRMEELRKTMVGADDSALFLAAVVQRLNENYGELLDNVSDVESFERARASWENLSVAIGKTFTPAVVDGANSLADAMDAIADALDRIRAAYDATLGLWRQFGTLESRMLGGPGGQNFGPPRAPQSNAGITTAARMEFTTAQLDTWIDYQDRVSEINASANEARLNAERQYAEQRADAIRQYNQTILREAEDFGRQRVRQQQQLERQIARIDSDAAERLGEWVADLQERIGEVQARGNERLAEIERDYQKNRERAERDHRDRLLGSAARLDAVAVLEAQRQFARSSQDAEEGQRERLDKEQANMQRQIADAQKAHDKRLADQRKADERRIQDLRANLAEQQRIENEDRAIRLARMAEDHQSQLGAMATAHAARMEQIGDQQGKQLASEQAAFNRRMSALGVFNEQYENAERARRNMELRLLNEYMDKVRAMYTSIFVEGPLPQGATRPLESQFPSLTDPNSFSRRLLPSAQTTGSRSVSVGEVSIAVHAAPGQSPVDIGREVRREMTSLLEELAQ